MTSSTSAPCAGKRARQGVVIGRRVGRRIDDLDAHGRALSPCWSPIAWSTRTGGSFCSPACARSSARSRPISSTRSWCSTTPPTTARREAVRELRHRDIRLIALDRREGKAANDSRLLQEARGEYCLLLNEDSELRPGAVAALLGALHTDRGAAAAGAQLLTPDGREVPCAWRLPSASTALAGALFLHRRATVESGAQRHPAGGLGAVERDDGPPGGRQGGGLARPGVLRLLGRDRLLQAARRRGLADPLRPRRAAIHHDQMAQDAAGAERRIVEYHRNRDLYLRKHHGRTAAALLRPLLAWPYLLRALAATRPARALAAALLAARPPGAASPAGAKASGRRRRPTTARPIEILRGHPDVARARSTRTWAASWSR